MMQRQRQGWLQNKCKEIDTLQGESIAYTAEEQMLVHVNRVISPIESAELFSKPTLDVCGLKQYKIEQADSSKAKSR